MGKYGRKRSFVYQDVGSVHRYSKRLPGDCTLFLSGLCETLAMPVDFWKHRKVNEHWFPKEDLALDLLILRMHVRYFRHRWDFEAMFLTNACKVHEMFRRHRMMEEDFPELWRACLKIEGEQAGRFVLQVAKESGYVEACHPRFSLRDLRETDMVYKNLDGFP